MAVLPWLLGILCFYVGTDALGLLIIGNDGTKSVCLIDVAGISTPGLAVLKGL